MSIVHIFECFQKVLHAFFHAERLESYNIPDHLPLGDQLPLCSGYITRHGSFKAGQINGITGDH